MTRTLGSAPPATVPGRLALRVGPISGVLRWRSVLVLGASLLALLAAVVLNTGLGEYHISVEQVLTTLVGGGDRADQLIIWRLRMPRSLTGLLVGAALGVSGAIMQTITRNPLASPDLLGITWGAGAAVTAVIALSGTGGVISNSLELTGVPMVALIGGLVTGLAVYALASRSGVDSYRLVLVGVGVTALTSNATHWLLTVGDVNQAGRAWVWIIGSLNARGWEHVVPLAVALAVLLPLTLAGSHALDALQFDADTVRGLGVRIDRARALLLISAVLLASAATAAAGPVTFVALATPQIAMRLAGRSRPPLLTSLVLGATFVVGADLLARAAFGGLEIPVGIVTAVLGAPYLIVLLAHRYREVRA